MDYNEWKAALFEDIYPQAQLTFGSICFDKKLDDTVIVKWGRTKFSLDINDFYKSDSLSPLQDIKKWVYANISFIEEEASNAYVVYNPLTECFDAYVSRPMGTCFTIRNVSPLRFPGYGNVEKVKQVIVPQMEGTILCFHSKEKKVPSLLAVSERKAFVSIVNDFLDYHEKMAILLPDSIETNYVFVGHVDSISRFSENFSENTSAMVTAGDWFNVLELKAKEKHV